MSVLVEIRADEADMERLAKDALKDLHLHVSYMGGGNYWTRLGGRQKEQLHPFIPRKEEAPPKSLPLFLISKNKTPYCAYPTRTQADVYASGFSTEDGVTITPLECIIRD